MTTTPAIKFYDRIVQSFTEPENKHVLWSDITDVMHPVLKYCVNDEWVPFNSGGGINPYLKWYVKLNNKLYPSKLEMVEHLQQRQVVDLGEQLVCMIFQGPPENIINGNLRKDTIYVSSEGLGGYYCYGLGLYKLFQMPLIPDQVQADWEEEDTTSAAYIRNKPRGKINNVNVYNQVLEYSTDTYQLHEEY